MGRHFGVDRKDALTCTVIRSPKWSYMGTLHPSEGYTMVSTGLGDPTVVAGSASVSALDPDLVATSLITEFPRGVR